MERKSAVCKVAVILVAAVLVIGFTAGGGTVEEPQKTETPQESATRSMVVDPGNYIPPRMIKVVGTVRQEEGHSGVCVLDVTAVYVSDRDWVDFEVSSAFEKGAIVGLADGSRWDFTPGEALSFNYVWHGEGADGPKTGDEVFLLFRSIFPDSPMFIEPGEMYFVTEEV